MIILCYEFGKCIYKLLYNMYIYKNKLISTNKYFQMIKKKKKRYFYLFIIVCIRSIIL